MKVCLSFQDIFLPWRLVATGRLSTWRNHEESTFARFVWNSGKSASREMKIQIFGLFVYKIQETDSQYIYYCHLKTLENEINDAQII